MMPVITGQFTLARNKESLLKMEIESVVVMVKIVFIGGRNKESLLKMEIERLCHGLLSVALLLETKKVS